MSQSDAPSKLIPLKGATTQENAAVLVSTCTLQWYGLARSPTPGDTRKQVAAGEMQTIKPGMVFRSKAELKNKGVDEEMIDHWISRGALRYQTFEGMMRGKLDINIAGAPIVMGNTDGVNPHATFHQNKAGRPFGWHPSNLERYDMDGLLSILAAADPTIAPPDSRKGVIDILSRDFN